MSTREQIDGLKRVSAEVMSAEEAGITYYLLPRLKMPAGCQPSEMDVLLCPTARDGYHSRLFFAERVSSTIALNWREPVHILERTWQVFSWQVPPQNQTLLQILLEHLGALTREQ
ncbi:MAG: hypothetical protein ACKVQW_03935 [Pyrinomonadaceae bacterium]